MIDGGHELCVENNQLHIQVQNNWLKIHGQFFGATGPASNNFYNRWQIDFSKPALQYIVMNKEEQLEILQKNSLKDVLLDRGLVLSLKAGEAGRVSEDLKQLKLITENDQVLIVNFSGTYNDALGPSFRGILSNTGESESQFSIFGYKTINSNNVVKFLLSADTYISTKIEVSIEIFNNKEFDLSYEAGDVNYSLIYVYLGNENRLYTKDDENLTLRKKLKVSAKDITPNFKTIKVKYSGNN